MVEGTSLNVQMRASIQDANDDFIDEVNDSGDEFDMEECLE